MGLLMAIYHLHAKVIQRSKGKNVIAASSYRRAARLYDEREARHWDYRSKFDVIHSEITVPANAPDWVHALVELHQKQPALAAEQLWNQLDQTEKRADAQLAREIEFALPIELNEAQSIELARAFIHDQFVMRGMIADWSVHWNQRNPHVHVLLTMRSLTESGFGQRVLAWNSKALLQTWREQWAEYTNFHLHGHQHDVRIDHRSYAEQGIDLVPGIHEGFAAREMVKRGIGISRFAEAAEIRTLNLARLSENAEIVFRYLSTLGDTFTDRDLSQVLSRYVPHKSSAGTKNAQTVNADAVSDPHPPFVSTSSDVVSLEKVLENTSVLTPERIEQILQAISQHESVFAEKDIAKAVEPLIEQADEFAKAVMEIKQSDAVIFLGAGEDGRDRFTTHPLLETEYTLQQIADELRETAHILITKQQQQAVLSQHEEQTGKLLTDEQKAAVWHILKPSAIACVIGRAGTGKSFCLGAAKSVWESQGLNVQGIALSGIAADGLSKDVGIPSRTIKSFTYRLENGLASLNANDVVIMDEAGMTDSHSMLAVLKSVQESQAKMVLVGDPAQLQPVGPGATFRALVERLGFAEIQTVYRQSVPWQREATVAFSAGDTQKGLAAYQAAGCIHFEATPDEAIQKLLVDWQALVAQHDVSNILVISHRNEDIDRLNTLLRAERVQAGILSEGYRVKTHQGEISIAAGDRILFLKNDKRINAGLVNGRFATIQFVDFTESGNVIYFTAKLDGSGDVVTINPQEYTQFTYGYAATIHKTQGSTVDHSLIYAGGKSWTQELTYVAFTRHRQSCHLYADQKTHEDEKTLVRRLSRFGLKDSVLDFPLAFAKRRQIDPPKTTETLPRHLSERLRHLKKHLIEKITRWINPHKRLEPQTIPTPHPHAIEKMYQRREDARVVASYVDARREVGITWQALQAKLTAFGLTRLPYKERNAFELVQGTAEYIALKAAQHLRNQKAHDILQEPKRYEKALVIHQVDHDQLEKYAAQHCCSHRVQQYVLKLQSGFEVYRDYFALQILSAIKSHYPYLQDAGLNTTEHRRHLRTHALSYLRRQCFLTLTANEREGFHAVEAYRAAAKQAADYWLKAIKPVKAPTPEALKCSEEFGKFRDTLAHAILMQPENCQKALAFYQIGVATSQFGVPLAAEQHQQAQKRWDRLQRQAAYHAARERVASYQKALEKNHLRQRFLLAYDILQDAKAHHGAIIGLGKDTKALWRSIRQDATHQTHLLFYRTLDAVDRLGFREVKRYVEAKNEYTGVWREFFNQHQAKKSLFDHPITPDTRVSSAAMFYNKIRNEQAAKLLGNQALYQRGLDYFGITLGELNAAAYRHQCALNVAAYHQAASRVVRAEKALALIADPKAHAPFIKEQPLDWKIIYRDARMAERRQYFATLSPIEKSLYCFALRYRKTNQLVGKQYAAYKAATEKLPFPLKLERTFARRDYLAWRLVNALYEIDPAYLNAFAEQHKLNAHQLFQQHARHTEKLTRVERYQHAYQAAIQAVQAVYFDQNQQDVLAEKMNTAITKIHQAIYINHRHPLDQCAAWQDALHSYGVSAYQVTQQINGLNTLKSALQSFALSKEIVVKPVQQPTTPIRERVSARYSRLDTQRLRAALNERAEAVAAHYLGQPKIKQGHTWRYGSNKGSLVVTVHGARQGLWRDFQLDKGGDMLGLIQHALDIGDFKALLQEATRFLGGESFYQTAVLTPSTALTRKTTKEDTHTQERIQKAQAIYKSTQSIAGTLAERYLREHRGIVGTLDDKTFRYHPFLRNWMTGSYHPALVVVARDETCQVCGIQALFLQEKTAQKATQLNHNVKLSRGLIGEGAIVHQGKPEGKIALAEGVETALSIAAAQPDWTIYVTFGVGNFAKTRLPKTTKSVVICADNDGRDSATSKSVVKSADKLAQRGLDVWVVEPKKSDHKNKWDFNDALLTDGIQQIKQDLDRATLYRKGVSQENMKADLKETLAVLGELTTAAEIPTPDKTILISQPLQNDAINTLLMRYVEMELEQTRLVNAMHLARLQDPKAGKAASLDALAHADEIQRFAEAAVQHPEIKTILETHQKIKSQRLAERGGFISIHERLQQGQWLDEDIHTLAKQLRTKATSESRTQTRERSRGGRGR